MLRTVTISIMIGTFLIGTYYVLAASYLPPSKENKLLSALNNVQTDLTYEKFISINEKERASLVQQMPASTVQLLLEKVQNHPTYINEDVDKIKIESNSNELRFTKLTQVSGVKGYESTGTASIVYAGIKTFLRLEDFSVSNGIDQHIYLTKDGTPTNGIDIGTLKASIGNQNYDITGIDIDTYNIMVIYSNTFDTYYTYVKFLKTE